MSGIYRGLPDEIKRLEGDVFGNRVQLSAWRKLRIAGRWMLSHPSSPLAESEAGAGYHGAQPRRRLFRAARGRASLWWAGARPPRAQRGELPESLLPVTRLNAPPHVGAPPQRS